MKKVLLTVLAVLGFVLAANAAPQNFGTFNITVNTPATIAIALRNAGDVSDYTAWAAGEVALGGSTTMATAQAVLVKNTSNVSICLTAFATTPGGIWSVGSTAATNVISIGLYQNNALSSLTTIPATTLSTSDVTIASHIAVGANKYIGAVLNLPTFSSTGNTQVISVTITALIEPAS